MISAEVICDSISPAGIRLTTMKLRYPKFIHGEFMTHRVFSRNASSSRAIPTSKLLEEVRNYDLQAKPVFWGKNQSGMSAAEELSEVEGHPDGPRSERFQAQREWTAAAHSAANHAEKLLKIGAHKQIVNRILEPFSHINVVVTATEWNNFFGLRLDKGAQPEMRALAIAMYNMRAVNVPTTLSIGQWHLPFVSDDDWRSDADNHEYPKTLELTMLRVSVARCARVSYESFDTGKRSTIEEDLALYDKLMGAQPVHASPAEHQATPDEAYANPFAPKDDDPENSQPGYSPYSYVLWRRPNEHGNLRGWRQHRKMIPGEACAPIPGYTK